MHQKVLVLDFGSQYSQLIARRVRETNVYCEIHSCDVTKKFIHEFSPNGIILSGGPASVTKAKTPRAPQFIFKLGYSNIRHLLRHANHGRTTWRLS